MDAETFSAFEAIIKDDITKINNDPECYMKETEEFFETAEFKKILEFPHIAECMIKILDLPDDKIQKHPIFIIITAALKKRYMDTGM